MPIVNRLLPLLAPLAVAFSPSHLPYPVALIPRRSFIQPVLAIPFLSLSLPTDAVHAAGPSVSVIVTDGMKAFAAGEVEKSLDIYDAIIAADPRRKPYLWQRGLSLYYAERYKDGAEQFAADVAVNPNDTEEQIWHLLCLSRLKEVGGLEAARSMKLSVGRDRRPVMRVVQNLFLSGGMENERDLVDLAMNGDRGSRFYAPLYLSLYFESMGDGDQAKKWMVEAVGTDYAKSVGAGDPMVELAKVAVRKRGWSDLTRK